MSPAGRQQRQALSLIELLIVTAIMAVLIALVLSAVQMVRESAHRSHCQHNLRQLVLATQHFHDAKGTMPTYFGIHPPTKNQVISSANSSALYGGWFAHLLPFVEEQDLHSFINDNVRTRGQNTALSTTVTIPATGTWIPPVPGTPDRWNPPRVQVIEVPGTLQWVAVQSQNGYVTYVQQLVGQTWRWDPPQSTFIPGVPGRPGHWDPPGSGPRTVTTHESHGIWLPEAKGHAFKLLLCPSDPSITSDPEAGQGRVYVRSQDPAWGSTNYVANWWAFSDDNQANGWFSPPQPLAVIKDGLSNTVLFAEAYSWCDGIGRIALYPPNQHNFGITQALPNARNQVVIDGQDFQFAAHPRGYPNTWMFQIRPKPLSFSQCPAGASCCNRWVAQSAHSVLNVALADGAVRSVAPGLSPETWRLALQPRDGERLGEDW